MARILAADDDGTTAARLAEMLRADAHEVLTANGGDAESTFAQRGPFDLVVIGLTGAEVAGIELCRRLKAASFEFLPVMLLAAGAGVEAKVAGLDAGADECLGGELGASELQARVRALLRIRDSHRHAADVAHVDLTTGIPNRRALEALLKNSFALAQRQRDSFSLLTIDLDGLEKINVAHGRDAGDEVRRVSSGAILGALRATDGAYCIQGGEFVVVAPGADVDGAILLGERIRRAIESALVLWRDAELRVTASVGLAVIPDRSIATAEELLVESSRALQAAKKAGRNCLMVHGDDGEPSSSDDD